MSTETQKSSETESAKQNKVVKVLPLYHAEDFVDDVAFLEKRPPKLCLLDKTPAYLRQITYKGIFVSFDFLKAIQQLATKNCILSPIGLAAPLSVLGAGSANKIELEIKDAMRWELVPWDHALYYFAWVMSVFQLNRRIVPNTLFFSVHVFFKSNSKLNDEYRKLINKIQKYQVVQVVSSLKDLEPIINQAFEKYTCGNCQKVVPSTVFTDRTEAVIVSVCYMKPIWRNPFQERYTRYEPFYVNRNVERQVHMMKSRDLFRYNENLDVKIVGIYFKAGRYVLYLILPKVRNDLARIENRALKTPTKLEKFFELIEKSAQNDVIVEIPRFKIIMTQDIAPRLQGQYLNMKSMFEETAKFPKISAESLHVDHIFQTVGLDVSEMGMRRGDQFEGPLNDRVDYNPYEHPPYMLPKQFIANHPFLFLLLDRESNAVFQFGRIADPTENGQGIVLDDI